MKADKNPNTAGAMKVLEINGDANQIIQKAKQGEIDLLYVFGHDLVKLYGKETVEQIAKKVKLIVFQGSNINETCAYAHLNLPSSVYAEKEGTFTNCQQKVQRIWPAFLPMAESKGDWEIMAMLSAQLGAPMLYKYAQDIFKDIAATVPSFAEMTYEKISDKGMVLKG
jgi:predicted molibdopterin-dependent oxidoreductase YjgC